MTDALYPSNRAIDDIRVYVISMVSWLLILALIIAANLLGSRIVFIF